MTAAETEPAPAKVNLFLHVTGRRAEDGYHLLDSLAVFGPAADSLEAMPAQALTLSVEGPFGAALTDEADNLVLRAARALAGAAGGWTAGIGYARAGGAEMLPPGVTEKPPVRRGNGRKPRNAD